MQDNPVGWFEIYVKDMNRARRFYESVFELKLEQLKQSGSSAGLSDMWTFPMQRGGKGAAGALAKMENGPSGAGGTIVYFMSADCAVQAKRAASNGGKIVKDKFSIGEHGHIALVSDTEGNMIGIHSMK